MKDGKNAEGRDQNQKGYKMKSRLNIIMVLVTVFLSLALPSDGKSDFKQEIAVLDLLRTGSTNEITLLHGLEEYVGHDGQKSEIKQSEDFPLLVVETKTKNPRIIFCTVAFQKNIGVFKIKPTMVIPENGDPKMLRGKFVDIKPDKTGSFLLDKDPTKFAKIEPGREFELVTEGTEKKVVRALHGVFVLTDRRIIDEKPLLIKIDSSKDLVVCTAWYDKLLKRFAARAEYVVRASRDSQEIYEIKGFLIDNDKYNGLKPTIENNLALIQPGTKASLIVTKRLIKKTE